MLGAGWLCDHLGDGFILALRYFAFGLGVVNVIILLIPREVEYPAVSAPKFSDILSIPLRHKKFMRTMLVVFLWQFAHNCYSAQLNYYLLETVGMTKTFYNIIIFLYGPFFILFMTFWRRRIEKTSWFKVFAYSLLIVAPLQILYGFIRPGDFTLTLGSLALTIPLYAPLALIVRLPQHFGGVGHNTAFANFQYINMPLTNRDCFTAFYQLVFNLGSLSGMLFGIVFTELAKDLSFTAFGYTYRTGTPLLTMICGALEFIIIAYVLIGRKKLEPDTDMERA
jgi:predicted MFS family arabinose efflux permease